MRKEIEKTLLRLKIEGKETRKATLRNILIWIILVAFFFGVPYLYPQFGVLSSIGVIVALLGGAYVFFQAIPTLFQPLKKEYYAFTKIARAIQILEKSNEPIAYEEAYRYIRHAHEILRKIELGRLEWYEEINETFLQFLENLQLTVLPAVSNSSIKREHLEEIALALVSMNPDKLETTNKTLETDQSYKKTKPPPTKIETFARRFGESKIGQIVGSIALGYSLILIICLVYVVATEQDFMMFVRGNPEVVILGGLGISGITFWKTK